jgi:probable phosphomutase (TIGR03848 family)
VSLLLLVRHALTDFVSQHRISGRLPGVPLNAEGRAQAERLSERLADVPVAAIYTSPQQRARETAAPLAARHGLAAEPRAGLDEIDFGSWTGLTVGELEGSPQWRLFNSLRSSTRIPGGELMLEVQARVVRELKGLRSAHPDGAIVVVSHGDVIRAALLHFLGMSLDHVHRVEIAPASVTVLALEDWGPRLLLLNDTGTLPRP